MPREMTRAAADIRPSSFDAEARTVDVVWSTGAGVLRRDASGPFNEILSLNPAHVDLSRLNGAAVLNSHRQESTADVIGVVTNARIENGQGVATIKFSGRAGVSSIIQDVADGVLRHVSVGYSVSRWSDGAGPNGRTRTATAWTPFELSFVPVPADPGAATRSDALTTEPEPAQTATPPANDNRAQMRAQIRAIAETAGLKPAWADAQIDAEATVEAARSAAFVEMQTRTPALHTQVGPSLDGPDKQHKRIAQALACRALGSEPPKEARQFMAMGVADTARLLLEQRGERTASLSREGMLHRALTTTDLPNLLLDSTKRMLRPAYELAQSPLKALARETSRDDFRPVNNVRFALEGALQPISESGELQSLGAVETEDSYTLNTYGGIVAWSRKAIINDDLGAIGRTAAQMGRLAAQMEANTLVNLLTSNSLAGPVMGDGFNLFSTQHANISDVAGSLYLESGFNAFDVARKAMRLQKDIDGVTPIAVAPKTVIIGPSTETATEELLAVVYPVTTADVNVFQGRYSSACEPRITHDGAYFFADPAIMPVLEFAYLSGAPGPQIQSEESFDILGRRFRIFEDFGAGVIDYRGAYFVAGQ